MRKSYMISVALLVLASASVAGAQQKAAAPAKPALEQNWELGFRATTVDGDEARYERYQSLKNGLFSQIGITKESDAVAYSFNAFNVGYDDQAYAFNYNRYGKAKFSLSYNGQPLNYAYNTVTPYRYAGNNKWTLDPTLRTRVQNKEVGVVGIPNSAATYATGSIYRTIAQPFEMSALRNTLAASMKYRINTMLDFDVSFQNIQRSGNQPWGAAFAFSSAQEIPMAIDNVTNELTAGLEFRIPKYLMLQDGMLRAEYQGSFFKQNFLSMEWDNPIRATDFDNLRTPPTGPWDPSGYSNGNGPAFGRMAMAPSNEYNSFRVMGLFKLPYKTTVNGQFMYGVATNDEELIPWTTNTKINQPATYLFFPGLAQLPRPSAEAETEIVNAVVNLTSRPTDYFAFDMKYRFNDLFVNTPRFDYTYHIRFDAVPENIPGGSTHHLDFTHNTVDAGVTFTLPNRFTALRVGYVWDDIERGGRSFSDMTDKTIRASLDAYQNKFFSLRGNVEMTERVGKGLSEEIWYEIGHRNTLRFYDEADMDRTKAGVVLGLTPSSKFDLSLSYSMTDDEYTGEGHEFGLLSATSSALSLTGNWYLNDKVTIGGTYGMDNWKSNQLARNANPDAGPTAPYNSWADPLRNWFMDNDEDVTSAGLWIDLMQVLPKTDIKFSYDFSDSDLLYSMYGPRIEAFKAPDNTALRNPLDSRPCATGISSCFIPWPNVTNSWTQMKLDIRHMMKENLGLGLGFRYQKFDVVDFNTLDNANGTPRFDSNGLIGTGYGNRPFDGTTIIAKLIYKF
ncbi:MAG: MtrB/PioB family outer membrane beta-barrel protein [Gemmatimonadetes bacterium]|nr:MtrB/PioB family outer membrane beta-barrel protein [Gemmatimonadota bacterium]